MANKENSNVLTVQEAMDNLSALSDIDIGSPAPIGIVKNNKLILHVDEVNYKTVLWVGEDNLSEIYQSIQETYKTIYLYLEKMVDEDTVDWNNAKTRKGLQAMMALVGDSANQIDMFASNCEGSEDSSVKDLDEYKKLQHYYLEQVQSKFSLALEGQDDWGEHWQENDDSLVLDLEKRGLEDFETVRRDREYELFYLKNVEGKPFFNRALLRNIKLVCDFDETATCYVEDDPLLQIRSIQDRDLQATANQLLHEIQLGMEMFYTLTSKGEDGVLSLSINKMLMALMLTANTANLIQNTEGKNCIQYFEDFKYFLHEAFLCEEYKRWIAYPPEKGERTPLFLLEFVHEICAKYFYTAGGIKQEMIAYIHRLARMGREHAKDTSEPKDNFWAEFIHDNERIRALLHCFPNGPLFKILDLIRQEDPSSLEFNPLRDQSRPGLLYHMETEGRECSILRIACPTTQKVISSAQVNEEFIGLIRSYGGQNNSKHVMINLQDRTAWKEHARSSTMEKLQRRAEFRPHLFVNTLNKDTDFYHQSNEYLKCSDAKDFISLFEQNLSSPEDYGFFFCRPLQTEVFAKFIKDTLKVVHNVFFDGNKTLNRKNRLDFIEICYHLIVLKIIEILKPDSVSFSCKDAMDTGACFSMSFYAFIKTLSMQKWSKEQRDFTLWLAYAPALSIRERAVDPQRVSRSISAIAHVESIVLQKKEKAIIALSTLYNEDTLFSLDLK